MKHSATDDHIDPSSSPHPADPDPDLEIKPTICSICNVSTHCGVDCHVKNGNILRVTGSRNHPSSRGKLCIKGAAGLEYVYSPDRVLKPLLRQGERGLNDFKAISWDEALDRIADKLDEIRCAYGPESVVFAVGYTKWLRPFLKRLAFGFGSPNYITESSTCHTAMDMAFRLNYGAGAGADLKNTHCLLNWGCNPIHAKHPGFIQDLAQRRRQGMQIIDVGPLVTPLTRMADLHLRLRPGTSGALALGMAHVIIRDNLYDREFVENWTHGFKDYLGLVEQYPPEVAQEITGVKAEKIVQGARMYAQGKPSALATSASTTVHHTNGMQNARAVTALIGLTGNWDMPGGNVVNPATYLYVPAGLSTRQEEFEFPKKLDEMALPFGSDAFPVWHEMVDEAQGMRFPFRMEPGDGYPLRAMLAFGLNYRMWPGSDYMRDALKKLDFLVDIDLFRTDTAKLADIILPACSSFERSELKFYAQRYVIWTQPAITPLGESKSDADIICELAKRLVPEDELLGGGHENCVDWILQPSGLSLSELKKHPEGFYFSNAAEVKYKKYQESGFSTPSQKMEFSSTVLESHGIAGLPVFTEPLHSPRSNSQLAGEYPLILTTGARKAMFIHSRGFRMPSMTRLQPHPTADINPVDAAGRGIGQNDWILVSSPRSGVKVRANLTENTPPGTVNMYHCYPGVEVNELFYPDYLDPITGFAGFKSTLCHVERL